MGSYQNNVLCLSELASMFLHFIFFSKRTTEELKKMIMMNKVKTSRM